MEGENVSDKLGVKRGKNNLIAMLLLSYDFPFDRIDNSARQFYFHYICKEHFTFSCEWMV